MLKHRITALLTLIMVVTLQLAVPVVAVGNVLRSETSLAQERPNSSIPTKKIKSQHVIKFLTTTPKIKSPEYKIYRQVKCLADNIYYEAGGEPDLGKVAVARVTMNRVEANGGTVCQTVYQGSAEDKKSHPDLACQFSWTCVRETLPKPIGWVYARCFEIAAKVMFDNYYSDFLSNVYYFHADYIKPPTKVAYATQIGRHKFYYRTYN